MNYFFKIIDSPVGALRLVAGDKGLKEVLWLKNRSAMPDDEVKENNEHPVLKETAQQLREYFNGSRKQFTVPLDFTGTDFQKKVWNILLSIPYGETRTYGEIAKLLGDPKASQAVGSANGRNPIAIIAPCHRVVGSTGKLIGFGGGIENKILLLDLENPSRLSFG